MHAFVVIVVLWVLALVVLLFMLLVLYDGKEGGTDETHDNVLLGFLGRLLSYCCWYIVVVDDGDDDVFLRLWRFVNRPPIFRRDFLATSLCSMTPNLIL